MSTNWLLSKQDSFVRDVLRDFCQVASALESHFAEYDASGEVSFHFFNDILGRQNSKGLLWRLKDTAHLLFRNLQKPAFWENIWTGRWDTSSTNASNSRKTPTSR